MSTVLVAEEKRLSAVDSVIENIKRWLLTKKLKPGDRMPNEFQLSTLLATSRGSIREAMKILAAFGIVEIRQGDGTYIARKIKSAPFDPLLFSLIASEADTRELSELRESIECTVVKLIIENASDDELIRLKELHRELEDLIAGGSALTEEIVTGDLAFHHLMAAICGNRLIEKIYNFIMEFLQPTIKGKGVLRAHYGILNALMRRDLEMAVTAIKESYTPWQDDLPDEDCRNKQQLIGG